MSVPVTVRILYWPILLTFVWPVVLILIWCAPESWSFLLGLLVIYIGWPLSALGALIVALLWLRKRSWRRVLSALVLPLATLVAYLNGDLVANVTMRLAKDLQLLVALPGYLREIAQLPADQGPRLHVFVWRADEGDLSGSEVVVYDESGQIAAPEQGSVAWNKKADDAGLSCRMSHVHHAFGSFYFVGRGFECGHR
jgi:hypothetical protein